MKCEDTGFVTVGKTERGQRIVERCNCKEKKIQKERMEASGVDNNTPEKYKGATFENFEEGWQDQALKISEKYAKKVDKFLPGGKKAGQSLYLCGVHGTGKTHLMYAIKDYVIRKKELSAVAFSTEKMLGRMKDYDDYQRDNFENLIKTIPLLLLDDISHIRSTDWEQEKMKGVIDERYRENRPMVITDNMKPEALEKKYGGVEWAAIKSRLQEICAFVELEAKPGETYREKGI